MKHLFAALIVSALVLLSGCAQRTIPQACQSSPQDRLANCIYVNSVLEQNPYYCYSLSDMGQRQTCLHDSTEPSMRAAVERATQDEKNAVFAGQNSTPQQPPAQQPKAPEPKPDNCTQLSGDQLNACLRADAVSSLDVSSCGRIADAPARQSCIGDVARKTKDIASCGSLRLPDDVSLCKLYAKGEESK